jgi:hypothetical protein
MLGGQLFTSAAEVVTHVITHLTEARDNRVTSG